MNPLESARAARDAAKATMTQRLSFVRDDLDTRSIGGRITDKIVGETADVALETIDVVENHKLVIGGTLAAIVLWFMRNPLIAAFQRLRRRLAKGSRKGIWS